MSYANTTVVPVERSKSQIEALLVKYGAEALAFLAEVDAELLAVQQLAEAVA